MNTKIKRHHSGREYIQQITEKSLATPITPGGYLQCPRCCATPPRRNKELTELEELSTLIQKRDGI